jgi:hypothetical protein
MAIQIQDGHFSLCYTIFCKFVFTQLIGGFFKRLSRDSESIVGVKRRVEFTIEKLKKEDEPILEWKVYKKAGLRPTVSNEVKRLITLRTTEYETVK